jgi:lipid-A-disaccharide synthase
VKPKQIMLIAGEASGDTLAAELVGALREELTAAEISYATTDSQPLRTGLEPRFFGAGGPRMKAAGVDLAFDLTEHSVIGISDVLKNYLKFRRLFNQLLKLAIECQPDVIIGIDYGGFNLRFSHAIKEYVRKHAGVFHDWNPKIVQFVSPQVWASRASRAYQLERDYDLLLSIFPFEKDWYAKRVPKLRVEFVGHPMVERFEKSKVQSLKSKVSTESPTILLLPGSRTGELKRHLPVMLDALKLVQQKQLSIRTLMVLPNNTLAEQAKSLGSANVEIQIGQLHEALAQANVAIASTGTVTMECAFFGVPTVTLYKTSRLTYEIGKRIVKVKSLTMPNLLAGEEIYPEFIQDATTPENISGAALELLQDELRRAQIKTKLEEIISSLGESGASRRAAQAITSLLE